MQTTATNTVIVRLHVRKRAVRWIAAWSLSALAVLTCVGMARAESPEEESSFRRIGPTATVTEVSSGLPFAARVDTGATSCSIHCEAFEIDDPSDDPQENVGKPVRLLVRNNEGESQWIESKIAAHVTVKTSNQKDDRYKVQLNFRWEDVEKKVLVTLNDRQHMNYPLLLGRNFLKGDFLVDVALDAAD